MNSDTEVNIAFNNSLIGLNEKLYITPESEGIDVEKRWREWLDFEASIITNYGKGETVHG